MKNNLRLLFLLFSGLGISRNYAQTIGVADFDKLPPNKQAEKTCAHKVLVVK